MPSAGQVRQRWREEVECFPHCLEPGVILYLSRDRPKGEGSVVTRASVIVHSTQRSFLQTLDMNIHTHSPKVYCEKEHISNRHIVLKSILYSRCLWCNRCAMLLWCLFLKQRQDLIGLSRKLENGLLSGWAALELGYSLTQNSSNQHGQMSWKLM